jgi:preprotein translocase subunit SecG
MSASMLFLVGLMIFCAIIGIVLILLQSGNTETADASAAGGGAAGVFGSRGPAGFLSRATAVVAAVFFVSVLAINYIGVKNPSGGNKELIDKIRAQESQTVSSSATPVQKEASSAAQ